MADLLIATKAFCNTLKTGAFSGDLTMCPTKSEIIAAGLHIKSGYTYDNDQLVPQDHIERLDWEYTFTVDPTTVTFSSAGDEKTISVTSYKKQYSYSNAGNRIYVEGSQTNVGYSSENVGSGIWNTTTNTIKYNANEGSNSLSGTVTFTQNESGKTATVSHSQGSDSIASYENPVVTLSYSVIPAGGGTVTPTYSWTQKVNWVSGKQTTISEDSSTLNKIGSYSFTGNPTDKVNSSTGSVSATSKGTTASGETTIVTVTLKVTANGKSGSSSAISVKQEPNSSRNEWKPWSVSCSASPNPIAASGGDSIVSGTASRTGTKHWTSGSRENISDSATVTSFSLTPKTGFSLSGTTLTATKNTGGERECIVTGTYSGVSGNVTIKQLSGSEIVGWGNVTVTASLKSDIPAKGGTAEGRISVKVVQAYTLASGDTSSQDITSTATISYSPGLSTVSGSNLGTTRKSRTKINTVTVSATGNGSKSGSDTVDVFQQANSPTDSNYSNWGNLGLSASPNPIAGSGSQSSTISITKPTRTYDRSWTSESIQRGLVQTDTVTLKITTNPGNAFTLSGTTLSAGQNTTGSTRTAVVTGTGSLSGKINTVSVKQLPDTMSESKKVYKFSVNKSSLSFTSDGGSQTLTITSYYDTLTRTSSDGGNTWTNWTSSGTTKVTPTASKTGDAFSIGSVTSSTGNDYTLSVSAGANSSSSAKTGQISLSQPQSGADSTSDSANINVPLSQHYRITETKYLYSFSVNTTLLEFNKDGGTIRLDVHSKIFTVKRYSTNSGINWSGWAMDLGENTPFSSSITGTGFSIDDSGVSYIDIKATSNSSFSERTGSLTLTQNRSNIPVDSTSDNKTITVSLKQNFDSGTMIFVFDSVLNPYVDDVEIVITSSNTISAKFSKVYAGMTESYIVPVGTFTLTARKIPSMESVTLSQYSGNLKSDERVTIHVNVTF